MSYGERERRLEALGYPLDRVPAPSASYQPVVVDGAVAYLSGAVPFDGPGNLPRQWQGKVPSAVDLGSAERAAAQCAANLLRVLHAELGSLDRVRQVVRLCGYVNSEPDFTDQHLVMNGASRLLLEVLGERGGHARSAVGVAQLPLGCAVEVDMVVRLEP